MKCAFCKTELNDIFLDLGNTPLANNYITDISELEISYPLCVYKCNQCELVQIPPVIDAKNIFSSYSYFSSYSNSLLEHSKQYTDMIIRRLSLNPIKSKIVEVASNDGYLLQYFKQKGFNILGFDAATNIVKYANDHNISTIPAYIDSKIAKQYWNCADLLIANNVLAHNPNIKDFIKALSIMLKPNGVLTMEFPHLLKLIEGNQFDTIYHEHVFYFTLDVIIKIFRQCGLAIFDVEELSTCGGSIRIYVIAKNTAFQTKQMISILEKEKDIDYSIFQSRVLKLKKNILSELISIKKLGKTIVGYGAAAKGNTLINYCGIKTDLLDYVVDDNPHKQGKYLPGSKIPIKSSKNLNESPPDYLLILPWNIKKEIIEKTKHLNCRYIIPIPEVTIL